ncbi:MAG TPA: SGNH/GDSL hydrolase family protein [Myxococcota bacterium]|nr:SGNH/GDSL hydrolase family protein [Myxococcota bacterium]
MTRLLYQYDSTVGYRFVPGLKARIEHESGGYLLRTNGAGFRCRHEFTAKKAPGVFRILLFGDSFTAGDGVSDCRRYGEQVEALLPGTEVFNFGLPGSGTDQQYLIWREYASQLEHDLVVIAVLVENIRRVVARYRLYGTTKGDDLMLAKPYFTLEADGELALHHVPVPRAPIGRGGLSERDSEAVDRGGRLEWLRRGINRFGPTVKDTLQRVTRYQPLPGYDRADHPDWRLLEAILRTWIQAVPGPVLVCPIPTYQYIEDMASPKSYQARFRSLEDPDRVIVHDPLPDFLAHSRQARRGFRFERDVHMTPAAHRVLAESLAGAIEPLRRRMR